MADAAFDGVLTVLNRMATERAADMSPLFLQRMSEVTPRSISRLGEDLGMDELDRVEFTMQLEGEFGILIDDELSDQWTRLSDVVESVKAIQAEG